METKTYLKPTYLPTYLCDSNASSDSCGSSDSSGRMTFFHKEKNSANKTKKQKNSRRKFTTKNILPENLFHIFSWQDTFFTKQRYSLKKKFFTKNVYEEKK